MKFENNIPVIDSGLEVSQISFSGGRTIASIANHGGLTQLDYFGAQKVHGATLFRGDPISAWKQLFRACVMIDDDLYYLTFSDTRIFPCGYESHCEIAGVRLSHGMHLLNDALVYTLRIQSNPADKKVAMRLLHMGCTGHTPPTRTWSEYTYDERHNLAYCQITDAQPDKSEPDSPASLAQEGRPLHAEPTTSETWMGVTATQRLKVKMPTRSFQKWTFTTDPIRSDSAVSILFSHYGQNALTDRAEQLQNAALDEVHALQARYHDRMSKEPALELENKTTQSVLMNILPVIDSLAVRDIPGAIRAADSGYWVWGWDSMVHADAYGFGNDVGMLKSLLEFYRKTVDPRLGIFHALTLDGKPLLGMAPAAQCLYAVMLYQAYLFSGDKQLLRDYFPFAMKVIDSAGADEVAGSGLVAGVSLFPDAPEDLEQDGQDLSVFNNGIYYQALRCMAELARELQDRSGAEQLSARADRLLASFGRFFDPQRGYFVDSLSSRDFSQRQHYPSYAVLWVTPFAEDLVKPWYSQIADFMKNHLHARNGVRMLPRWDSRFMFDGNQLGNSMPVVENTYYQLRHMVRDTQSAQELLDRMAWYWRQLTIPEAMTCECINHGITLDNPGRKQAFCAKAWLSTVYHVVAGMQMDCRGIHFSHGSGVEFRARGLVIRNATVDLTITGKSSRLTRILFNGERLEPHAFIPYDKLKSHNVIELIHDAEA